jgi:hypothetical protein
VSQINVNPPPSVERVEPVDSGDRTAAAGINLITVVIVLGVLAIIAWYLFTGPLRSLGAGGTTNVNVNPAPAPTTSVNVNVPSAPNPAPSGGNNTAPANNTAPQKP